MRPVLYASLLNHNRQHQSQSGSGSPTNNFGNSGNWANPNVANVVHGQVVSHASHDDELERHLENYADSDEKDVEYAYPSNDNEPERHLDGRATFDHNDFDYSDEADNKRMNSKSTTKSSTPSMYGDDGTLKFCCDDHDLVEPPAIATPTSSNCSPIQPQYLEVLHNEENDPIIRSSFGDGYEIPVPDVDRSLTNSTSSFINNVGQTLSKDCLDKERTFSSSSTVSETSIVCVQPPPPPPTSVQPAPTAQPLSAHTILKVALPNMKEDCTSDESLLTTVPMHNADKVKPIYTNSKVDEVLNHDGKTIL